MQTIELQQGSPEWLQFRATKFTASDAPAMLGLSKYKTRQQLLHEKATGITEEVDAAKQALFNRGHESEAAARPIIEGKIGMDLYPVTGVCDEPDLEFLAASFDGLTMCESVSWEHKIFNASLAAHIEANEDLPDTHWPQVEHQLIVSGADHCVFTVSDGTESKMVNLEYKSKPERRKAVIDGWLQFAKDLSVYVPEEKQEAVKAEVIRDLPALTFDFDRTSLTVKSNLTVYKQAATELVEKSKQPLESDQDFANAESMVKFFKAAEEKLSTVSESVVAQVSDIDRFVKDVKEISESIRAARLNTEKQVKARKEAIKHEVVQAAKTELQQYAVGVENSFDESLPFKVALPHLSADFAGAIKGKKTVQSLKDACSDELARAKIEIDNQAAIIRRNAEAIKQHGKGLGFLFNDFTQIYLKDPADFILLVQSRINEYEAEQKRQEEIKRQQEAAQQAPGPTKAEPDAITSPEPVKAVQGPTESEQLTLSSELMFWADDVSLGDDAYNALISILKSHGIKL